MSEIPAISEQDVRDLVGPQSFQRGHSYYRSGAIFNARRQGLTLKASCEGSYDNAYRVEVTFGKNGITGAVCSCPVGVSCKHTAALLLTWLHKPEEFKDLEDVDAALQRRSKEELIVLVKQMLRQEPDLDALLEMPLPAAGAITPDGQPAPVDAEAFRRQAEAAFHPTRSSRRGRYYDDYDDGPYPDDAVAKLDALVEMGGDFERQGAFAAAAAVYEAVSSVALDHYEEYNSEDEFDLPIATCVEGLGRCLEGTPQGDPAREQILRALLAVYRFDVDFGGVGLSDEVPDLLVEKTTPDERAAIAGWVRDILPAGSDWSANWHRQTYGDLLLSLEEDTMDDETFLRVCRETGRTGDLVDRLLSLGRVDEAMSAAEGVTDYEALALADLFVRHGHGATGEAIMRERAAKTDDPRVLDWLKGRYVERGDIGAALEVLTKRFRMQPTLEGYREARALATRRDRWEPLRPQLRMFLREARHNYLLIDIYLDEGEIDNALHALDALKDGGAYAYGYGYGDNIALKIARAAEKTHPYAAIDIYQKQAERLIANRGRDNYNTAAGLLAQARMLYERQGQGETWQAYIAGLREGNRTLRALKEELDRAGL